jgi:hypothetical protein
MRYNQHFSHPKRRHFLGFLRLSALLLIVAVLAGVIYLVKENLDSSNYNSSEQATSAPKASYVAPSVEIFRTPYFQFQANDNWAEDTQSSGNGKYVYKSLRNNLIEHQLTVYVNSSPDDLAVTHVLVVAPDGEGGLKAVKLSEHCSKSGNFPGSKRIVSLDQVSVNCFRDDTRYTVLAGIAGGSTNMSLPRPDGSQAAYTIYYSNVTAYPDAVQFQEIMDSFQTR